MSTSLPHWALYAQPEAVVIPSGCPPLSGLACTPPVNHAYSHRQVGHTLAVRMMVIDRASVEFVISDRVSPVESWYAKDGRLNGADKEWSTSRVLQGVLKE